MKVRTAIGAFAALLTGLAFLLQFFIDLSTENMACAIFVVCSFLSVYLYSAWTLALKTNSLSTFAILGFCVTTQWGALIAQTAHWQSLTNSLRQPVRTFATLALFQAIALLMHCLYRVLFKPSASRMSLARRALKRAGLYSIPSPAQLWLMGAIGCAAMAMHNSGAVAGKIADAAVFMAWAPFIMPLYVAAYDESYANKSKTKVALAIYAVAVALLGIALNGRAVIFLGFVTIALLNLLASLQSQRMLRPAAFWWTLGLVVCGWAIAQPISNLATAMELARGGRGKMSSMEMIDRTAEFYRKPDVLDSYRLRAEKSQRFEPYDESYISNPLLNRFVETKFHDNALFFASSMTSQDVREQLLQTTEKFFWSELPEPILQRFGVNIDKRALDFTMGDYLVYLSRGVPLGGYRTGSIFAQGLALFGWAFTAIYALLCIPVYLLIDIYDGREGKTPISPVGQMKIWFIFIYGITAESLYALANSATRGFLQGLIIYLLVFTVTSWLTKADRVRRRLQVSNAAAM